MKKISVIGSLNMDLVVKTQCLPKTGETIAGEAFNIIPGGKGANQAFAARRAGIPTKMIGQVGSDIFGKLLIENLQQDFVDINEIGVLENTSTGTATVIVEKNGDNRIIIVPGANSYVSDTFIDGIWDEISQSDMILMQHEIPLETVYHVVDKASQEGIMVALNAAPVYIIPPEILRKLDILIVNEIEGSTLSGINIENKESAITAAKILHHSGVKTVIVTIGSRGVVLINGSNCLFQPAFKVNVLDTTGAGDTFVGAYVASILKGRSEDKALLFATAASALTVTKMGAQTSIPDEKETFTFLQERGASI